MNLYDDLIDGCLQLVENMPKASRFKPRQLEPWECSDSPQIILKSDMAYELGGGSLPAVSMLAVCSHQEWEDEIMVIGDDLPDIGSNAPYARIALLAVDETFEEDQSEASRVMRSIEATRYHLYPKGFMMRISTAAAREPVRISRKALSEGMNFPQVGAAFIDAYHRQPKVQAVKLIFVTDRSFPYRQLMSYADTADKISRSVDSILDHLVMDCGSCGLKPVCDEIEGLRQFHEKSQRF